MNGMCWHHFLVVRNQYHYCYFPLFLVFPNSKQFITENNHVNYYTAPEFVLVLDLLFFFPFPLL